MQKTPKLVVLLIGSTLRVKFMLKIKKAAEEVGIISEVIFYKSDVTEKEILEKIKNLILIRVLMVYLFNYHFLHKSVKKKLLIQLILQKM